LAPVHPRRDHIDDAHRQVIIVVRDAACEPADRPGIDKHAKICFTTEALA